MENAKLETQKPFAYEDELKIKSERLNILNIELNLDKKDSALDTEPDKNDKPSGRNSFNHER